MIDNISSVPTQSIYLPNSPWSLALGRYSIPLTPMEEEYVVGHFNVAPSTLLCELLLTSLLLPTQQCGRSCIGRFLHDTLQSFYSHPHQTFIPKSGGNFSLPKLARRVEDSGFGRAAVKTSRQEYAA